MPFKLWSRAHSLLRAGDTLVHLDALYNFACYLKRDPREAEDLVHQTYLRALRTWNELAPGSNIKAWLFRILRNVFVSRYRQDLGHLEPAPCDTTERSPEEATVEGSWPGELEQYQLRQVHSGKIEGALRTLSEDARTVLLLDAEGFTECEMARVTGCSVGTVESRLTRARAALRLKLAASAVRGHS